MATAIQTEMMSDILTVKQKAWARERARQRCANVLYADQEIERGPQEAGIVRDLELALLMGSLEQAEQCWYSRTELAREIEEREKRNA